MKIKQRGGSLKVFEPVFSAANNSRPFNDESIPSKKLMLTNRLSPVHSSRKINLPEIPQLNRHARKSTLSSLLKEQHFIGWAFPSKEASIVNIKCSTIHTDINSNLFSKDTHKANHHQNPVLVKTWRANYIPRTKYGALEEYDLKDSLPREQASGHGVSGSVMHKDTQEGKEQLRTMRSEAARWYGSLRKLKGKAQQPPLNLNIRQLMVKKGEEKKCLMRFYYLTTLL
eukprot:TRINITY_DN13047_c0_g1_i1.p1 TRINITY_DN13047_c0_g1~~TRINITY_DN13047_c0_g1_i1.p1  ORF type:complete len:228 (-),score=9.55 TRINITY_DN13047_c0_g1_i1:105-788(-)